MPVIIAMLAIIASWKAISRLPATMSTIVISAVLFPVAVLALVAIIRLVFHSMTTC